MSSYIINIIAVVFPLCFVCFNTNVALFIYYYYLAALHFYIISNCLILFAPSKMFFPGLVM